MGSGSSHWAPLGRTAFFGEMALFGNWYPGYIAVNALMFGIGALLLVDALRRALSPVPALSLTFLTLVLFAPGVLSEILIAIATPAPTS